MSGAGSGTAGLVRVPAAVLVTGALLLLAGCHGSSAARSDTAATSPPAVTVTAGTASAAPMARSSAGQPDTAQLDEVDATLDRIEKELDSDGGR